jgi:Serine dehydrogenase proteinase
MPKKSADTASRTRNGRGNGCTARAALDEQKVDGVAAAATAAPPGDVTYRPSLPPDSELPQEFGTAVKQLEESLNLPVWMLVQNGPTRPLGMYPLLLQTFMDARDELAACGHVALLVDSPGGLAEVAYRLARILQRDGGFTVVIPRYAKSAATLLSLGATAAIMGDDAEIGPLDAQLWDEEREEPGSALNEVEALDHLHSVALQHLDRTMFTMVGGTKKRTDILLPIAARFVSDMMRPMLEKIDAVHYAKQARILAVAEHYAVRLLMLAGTPAERAHKMADVLVNGYAEHGFVIDRREVEAHGFLPLVPLEDSIREPITAIERILQKQPITALGRLKET